MEIFHRNSFSEGKKWKSNKEMEGWKKNTHTTTTDTEHVAQQRANIQAVIQQ